ncbi:MAG: DUF2190 family protein [Phycisphaera sp.]|nr:MAG: DUF2190 family protein [Phycisphaera sp.]
MKNQKQITPEEHIITWTNTTGSAVTAGTPVLTPAGWGVAHGDIAAGAEGTLYRRGRFEFTKAAGTAVDQGDRLWWDDANDRVSFTPTGTPPLMTANKAAADADTVVSGDLNFVASPAGIRHTVDSTEAAANSNDGQVDIDTGLGVVPTAVTVTVRTASTNIVKSGYTVLPLTGNDAGKVRIGGVAAGTQIDENDIIELVVIP